MLVYQAVAKTLAGMGVDAVFGLVGSGNFALVDYLTRHCGVSYYSARHESAAVGMSDAYARLTKKPGVCTVHQGPGFTNALTSLTEASKSRTPMVLISGATATTAWYANQQIDQEALAACVGAGTQPIKSPETAVRDTAHAIQRAQTQRRPIVVSLPIDIGQKECTDSSPHLGQKLTPSTPWPSQSAVVQAANALAKAQRPVVIAGRGAALSGAREQIERLGERIGALFATSAVANGFFSKSPFELGICGGFASPLASRLISQADLVLSFGASLNYWTTSYGKLIAEDAQILQCDIDPSSLGTFAPTDIGIVGDATQTATALCNQLEADGVYSQGFRTESLRTEIQAYRRADEFTDQSTEHTIDPRTLLASLDTLLPTERTVAVDSGHFMGYPAMYLSVCDPFGFVFAQAFQAVGLGLSTGIGAAIARPERITVCVLGDGGTMMSLAEIKTAVFNRLPMLIVILDDAAYGAEVHHFELLGFDGELARFEHIDFAGVASALGASAATVRRLEDLNRLESWLASPSHPFVLDCKVNPKIRAQWLEEAFRQ
jgi:thiamine pyrophosphate-dependent acetolactate synthase large subunit-like protein